MNILIKLMSIVSLVIAPSLAQIAAKKNPPVVTQEHKYEIKNQPVAVNKMNNTARYQ